MTGPRDASSVAGKRLYADPLTGEKFWSVTTIISGGLPKPALLPWGIKSVAEVAVAKRKTLMAMTGECERNGACTPADWCPSCDAAVRWLKSAPYQQRDKAADLGTKIHEAAEAYKLGKPMPPWPDDISPTMAQYERFLLAFAPSFDQVEQTVYNRTQRYAGTLDAILVLSDGRRLLVDYKTVKAVYPEVSLQLAAYRYAEYMRLPDNTEAPVPPVDGAAVLHLTPDAWQFIDVRADEAVFTAFLYCRETFRFMEELSKQVIGAALLPTNTLMPVEAA
jgi:hypothetical protein